MKLDGDKLLADLEAAIGLNKSVSAMLKAKGNLPKSEAALNQAIALEMILELVEEGNYTIKD